MQNNGRISGIAKQGEKLIMLQQQWQQSCNLCDAENHRRTMNCARPVVAAASEAAAAGREQRSHLPGQDV
jgi:hypothetical protein